MEQNPVNAVISNYVNLSSEYSIKELRNFYSCWYHDCNSDPPPANPGYMGQCVWSITHGRRSTRN